MQPAQRPTLAQNGAFLNIGPHIFTADEIWRWLTSSARLIHADQQSGPFAPLRQEMTRRSVHSSCNSSRAVGPASGHWTLNSRPGLTCGSPAASPRRDEPRASARDRVRHQQPPPPELTYSAITLHTKSIFATAADTMDGARKMTLWVSLAVAATALVITLAMNEKTY